MASIVKECINNVILISAGLYNKTHTTFKTTTLQIVCLDNLSGRVQTMSSRSDARVADTLISR